ncbi:MAG: dihydrolipoamide acetyltransferase family protein [Chloroflexi bacterium]|nr:dihydrolipoamide acetyltransferase family protein [Chloroflexota bacterium]MCY4246384.1 dihydrolipoamide acetyltransferase family protein [Chloroflexota bacterium]
MAKHIVLPKLGNTVESAIILAWHVEVGDSIAAGDLLCEIETDKATLEVESSATGTLLARLVDVGEEASVLADIAVVGEVGEPLDDQLTPQPAPMKPAATPPAPAASPPPPAAEAPARQKISPRARNLAQRKRLATSHVSGSGPDGRIIERDIEATLQNRQSITPVAQAMLESGDYILGEAASSRVKKADLLPIGESRAAVEIPLRGARKTIATRMLHSLQSTAQLTLHTHADATALKAFRARLKNSPEALGLRGIGINELLLFAVARALPQFSMLNALFENDTIYQHTAVHLAQAVDSERGLLAPVLRDADQLSLRKLAEGAQQLAEAGRTGKIQPDQLQGGTFTVSNLGSLGIESFTPVLNPPQVALLGVGAMQLKPIEREGEVAFSPHIGLSLTINHQVVDGAPAARFLSALCRNIADIDLLALG